MANGMGGLFVGVSALQSAQNAINTTAHNITNVNTTGYTRQQVVLNDSAYTPLGYTPTGALKSGVGVDVQDVRRCRDDFLDAAYRQELGRKSFYESQYEVVNEVENLFGEMDGVNFQELITDLRSAINQLSLEPTSTVARSAVIQSSVAFVERSNSIYSSLTDYQQTLNSKVSSIVDKINSLAGRINDLNLEINRTEANGESANDLRDERDDALDELGGLIKIEYHEDFDGRVEVYAEGMSLVTGGTVFPMGVTGIDGTNLVKPVWTLIDNKDVFIFNTEISTDKNNDIGELKGLLLARGDKMPNYKDVGETDYYKEIVSNSVLMKTVSSFDSLINKMVTDINDILCPEKEMTITTEGGLEVSGSFLDMDNTAYGMDENKSVGVELFTRNETKRYKIVKGEDGKDYYLRNDTNSFGLESLYSLGNISVNTEVIDNVGKMPLTSKNGEEAFEKTEAMLDVFKEEGLLLDPTTNAMLSYEEFYNGMIYDIGLTGETFKEMVSSETSMADSLNNRRQEVAGVSSDEELTNLIKFQNAYNAASRYISVVDEMLEHLVMRLGG